MALPPGLQVARRLLRVQRDRVGFQDGRQLDQSRLMLVGVVLAKEKFRARGQLRAHTGGSAAPIATISPG
jgi:hypothetical protein